MMRLTISRGHARLPRIARAAALHAHAKAARPPGFEQEEETEEERLQRILKTTTLKIKVRPLISECP